MPNDDFRAPRDRLSRIWLPLDLLPASRASCYPKWQTLGRPTMPGLKSLEPGHERPNKTDSGQLRGLSQMLWLSCSRTLLRLHTVGESAHQFEARSPHQMLPK